MIAIVVICWNQPDLILKQAELFKKYCKDEYELVVVDNSTDKEAITAIKWNCTEKIECKYMKTSASSRGGSESHSFAANFAFHKLKNDYDYFFFADHDLFPVKEFSVKEILGGYQLAGIGQMPDKKTLYLWPGCLMIGDVNKDEVDFSPAPGLDTGGNLSKLVAKHEVRHFDEEHTENPHFKEPPYNFYAMIYEGTFMHFIAGSGWAGNANNEERINSLLNILEAKTQAA